MKTCNGCNLDFDDSVPLYPRLIVSAEAKTAKKLAEKEGDEMLCLSCWLESVESLSNKQLAALLLGLLQKISELQNNYQRHWGEAILKDKAYGPIPDPNRQWVPNTGGGQWPDGEQRTYGTPVVYLANHTSAVPQENIHIGGVWASCFAK